MIGRILLGPALGLLAAASAGTAAWAMCSRVPLSQTQGTVSSFRNRPAGVLDKFIAGGSGLSGAIATVVSVDSTNTLPLALDLLRTANPQQRLSIGTGLGVAARACRVNGESATATRISQAVQARGDTIATRGYNVAFDPSPVAAPVQRSAPVVTGGGGLLGRTATPESSAFGSIKNPFAPVKPY